MSKIKRLTNSCLSVTNDAGTTLFDPGFFTFAEFDLSTIGDVQRVLITHEHADHVSPEFVQWLIDRGTDVEVFSNQAVVDLLAEHDIAASVDNPDGVASEDVLHEMIPTGAQPPNRSYTIEGLLTHPGDSYQPTSTAPVLALPLLIPWGSTTRSVEFARRLARSRWYRSMTSISRRPAGASLSGWRRWSWPRTVSRWCRSTGATASPSDGRRLTVR